MSVGETVAEREKADRLNHEWEEKGGIGLGGKREQRLKSEERGEQVNMGGLAKWLR